MKNENMKELNMEELNIVVGGELSEKQKETLTDFVTAAKYGNGWNREKTLDMISRGTGNDQESIAFAAHMYDTI